MQGQWTHRGRQSWSPGQEPRGRKTRPGVSYDAALSQTQVWGGPGSSVPPAPQSGPAGRPRTGPRGPATVPPKPQGARLRGSHKCTGHSGEGSIVLTLQTRPLPPHPTPEGVPALPLGPAWPLAGAGTSLGLLPGRCSCLESARPQLAPVPACSGPALGAELCNHAEIPAAGASHPGAFD